MTVKIVLAVAPSSSLAVNVCSPGLFWVGTVIMAAKNPFESTMAVIGTVGVGVPSHAMFTMASGLKPKPITVVAATPLSGIAIKA